MKRAPRSSPDQRAQLADLRANVTRAEFALRGAKEARRELRALAVRACAECRRSRAAVREQAPHVRRARSSRDAARRERSDAFRAIFGVRRGARSTSKERRDEAVERVEREIVATEPALLPYWRSIKARFVPKWKAEKGKRSLWEAFQEDVHEHAADAARVIAESGEREADRLIKERERELADAKREVTEFGEASTYDEDDFAAWLAKNPAASLVALGNAIEVELVSGRTVPFPPHTLLAYAKGKRCLRLVYGTKKTRARAPAAAAAEYEKTHWGKSGSWGMASGDMPAPAGKGSPIARIVYTTKKGGDSDLVYYEHDFEAPLPRLQGRQLTGGGYRVTEAGIVG